LRARAKTQLLHLIGQPYQYFSQQLGIVIEQVSLGVGALLRQAATRQQQIRRRYQKRVLVEWVLQKIRRQLLIVLGLARKPQETIWRLQNGANCIPRLKGLQRGHSLPVVEENELHQILANVDQIELAQVLQQRLNDEVAGVTAPLVLGLGQ